VILVTTASSDTYITNKLIESTQAVSGNVGRAGTLDIFKLYDESSYVTGSTELSRALIKFDLSKASFLASSSININSPSFKAVLKMKSLSVGQATPSNFTLDLFPLAVSFNEGIGRDIISFADVDYANFLERSSGSFWNSEGASAYGSLGDSNIDYFVSGNFSDGLGTTSLRVSQNFQTGLEDIEMDITRIVSATIAGILPDCGYRISFSEPQEIDTVTRFVKRFASRHVRDQSNRPTLTLSYDNSLIDNHSSSYFDVANFYVLHNTVRGEYRNFVSGSALSPIVGDDCLLVRFSTGSFVNYVTASQVSWGSPATGIYSASLTLPSANEEIISGSLTIRSALEASGSITLSEKWVSLDETVTFFSGFVTLHSLTPKTAISNPRKLRSSIFSTPQTVSRGTKVRLRCAFFDDYENNRSSRFSIDPSSLQVQDCRIRLRDTISGKLLFDFEDLGSKMSNDSLSNYFDFETYGFSIGVPIAVEFRFDIDGQRIEMQNSAYRLIVSE